MIEENTRLIQPETTVEDAIVEVSLRPSALDEYVGQTNIKQNLKIFIDAAAQRDQALEHVLLYGMPGLGKTSLAHIIANEIGANIKITSGPAIEKPGDLAALLTNLQPKDVLFIDEIHRLSRSVEEILYPALEDYALDIILGKGPSARTVRLDLPPFTLIGATTKLSMISSPLRDRFGSLYKLEFYESDELAAIITRAAKILGVTIDHEAALEVAHRSRKTPRIANRLLKRVRDFSQVKGDGTITGDSARQALDQLAIDPLGLDNTDRDLLFTMIEKFAGGPVGLNTISAAIAEDVQAIEQVIEPYLLQLGFINKTPKGRVVTPHAYKHFGLTPPQN